MKKKIILSGGVVKEMTYEEVLKQFKSMINKAANEHLSIFTRQGGEREDLIQELKLEAWKAFVEYDEKHAFSTFLTWKLKKVTGNNSQKITAQKRTSFGEKSMNAVVSDNEEVKMEDMFAKEDFTFETMAASEMMNVILPQLNEREKKELYSLLNPSEYSMADLAKELNMSRPAARQHLLKTQDKIKNILIKNDFVAI